MADLDHVLWIGGPSASGKTTVARRLASRHGLRWYNSDAMTWNHRDRALHRGCRAARAWETWRATPLDQRQPLSDDDMVAMSLHYERGVMTVEDLQALPKSPLIVAEGTQITPRIVPAGAAAIWLLPSVETQRVRWIEKHGPDSWPGWTLAGGNAIREEIRSAGVRVLVVDDLDPEQTLRAVESIFEDALTAGPTAATGDERRQLLRYANQTLLQQSRTFLARPWANAEPGMSTRSFLCECGRPDCWATVDLPITSFPGDTQPGDKRLLAPGHLPGG